jgi:glutamate racemase
VQLLQDTCPGLVQQIEQGNLDGTETRAILESALRPMLDRGIDTVVLGCTHYPFVIPLIEQIVGQSVRVIDPAPSVARQAERLVDAAGTRNPSAGRGRVQVYTSGDAAAVESLLPKLLGETGQVARLVWEGETRLVRP